MPRRRRGDIASPRMPMRRRRDIASPRMPRRRRRDIASPRMPRRRRGDIASPRMPRRRRGDKASPRMPRGRRGDILWEDDKPSQLSTLLIKSTSKIFHLTLISAFSLISTLRFEIYPRNKSEWRVKGRGNSWGGGGIREEREKELKKERERYRRFLESCEKKKGIRDMQKIIPVGGRKKR